ncbi:MAG TPA: nuclear transport factor 2 family protein [Kineosporiaceae bacterium]|nr:nuclear transport factor 2 family protein [Kineosporiaceae bacterium]
MRPNRPPRRGDAGEARDVDRAVSCLAEDVQIISPLTASFRFQGRGQAREMLTAGFEEAQLLRFDAHSRLVELTLFGRPLPGVTAVMAAIGPRMLHNSKQPALARLVRAATAPLAVLTRLGEKRLVPLADPHRSPAVRTRDRA